MFPSRAWEQFLRGGCVSYSFSRFFSSRSQGTSTSKMSARAQIPLHLDAANILFVGSPDCVLPDASGKFFAYF
jgi:hypothetical protein